MPILSKLEADLETSATLHLLEKLQQMVGRAIRGKDDVIRLALVALFARGHLLIEDVPGVGKTTLARALARSLSCTYQRIQFTSDMLPSDVIGVSVFNPKSQQFEFRPGPVFAHVVLADEINRTTPKTQSALLEAMNETQVTIDNHARQLPQPFIVIATQNPAEHHGTFPIPESQLDRFLMRIEVGYPSEASEKEILRGTAASDPLDEIQPVMSADEVVAVQKTVRHVTVDEELLSYLLAVVRRTRCHEQLRLGVSPRGSMSIYRAAQSLALLEGRSYCIPDDFKSLVIPVFAHRCVLRSRAAAPARGAGATDVLQEILDETPVPL